MAGKPPEPPGPYDILDRIRNVVRSIVLDISDQRLPSIYLDRYRNHCADPSGTCRCGYERAIGGEVISMEREGHVRRLDVMLRVLLIVQGLLQKNRHGSKRDIYYMNPSVFREQAVVDRAINDICILLQCSRHNLNVVSAGKGLVMGWLRFLEIDRKYDCIRNLNTAYPIPVQVELVEDIVSVAHYILVVEKETVFQRLANDKFCETNHCIVVTGRGYPDVSTRRFLRLLTDKLHLPAYCLVDCDPYGLDILMTYRFGTMQMAYDTKFLRVPEIRWIGAFPSDSEKYCLSAQCLLPLKPEDKKKAEAMLLRCYLHREAPMWRLELENMLQKGVKFELEALSASSISFLSEVSLSGGVPAYVTHQAVDMEFPM